MRIKRLKGGGIILVAARHNRRAIQAEKGGMGSMNPSRSSLNETLVGPPSAQEVAQLAKDRMRHAGIGKLRKDAVLALEFVFSLPVDHLASDRAFFVDCADWVGRRFGGHANILSADIHRDESNPHCHVLLIPLIDGRMVGSDLHGGRASLQEHQNSFHQEVAGRYGLERAPARLSGGARVICAQAVIRRLGNDGDAALRSVLWPQLRDAIERDPMPALLALGIPAPAPSKRLRTVAQVFTSPGKGPRKRNPIGFESVPSDRTLCPVGFTSVNHPMDLINEASTEAPGR